MQRLLAAACRACPHLAWAGTVATPYNAVASSRSSVASRGLPGGQLQNQRRQHSMTVLGQRWARGWLNHGLPARLARPRMRTRIRMRPLRLTAAQLTGPAQMTQEQLPVALPVTASGMVPAAATGTTAAGG